MATVRVPVQPTVIAWARKTAGLDQPTAARRLGVSESILERWESGDLDPTVGQLRRAANLYNRSLAVLFLPAPIEDPAPPVADFRRLDPDADTGWSPQLRAAIQRAVNQRKTLLDLRDTAPEVVPSIDFELFIDRGDPVEEAGTKLRSFLELSDAPPGVVARPQDLLNGLVRSVEAHGAIVIQTQRVPLAEMKGFSIADRPFPVVALNGSDWPRPKIFTLLHELVHLGLRSSGLCDMHEASEPSHLESDSVEHFCNQVAASALMPASEFLTVQSNVGGEERGWQLSDLHALASAFGASSEAALLRLIGLGAASWDVYWQRRPELNEAYEEARLEDRRRRQESPGGPSYYVVKTRDLGRAYITSVVDAFEDDAISSRDLAEFLGVRFDQLPALLEAAGR